LPSSISFSFAKGGGGNVNPYVGTPLGFFTKIVNGSFSLPSDTSNAFIPWSAAGDLGYDWPSVLSVAALPNTDDNQNYRSQKAQEVIDWVANNWNEITAKYAPAWSGNLAEFKDAAFRSIFDSDFSVNWTRPEEVAAVALTQGQAAALSGYASDIEMGAKSILGRFQALSMPVKIAIIIGAIFLAKKVLK
jgi:hypothetical protein